MTLMFRQVAVDAPPFKPSAYGLLSVATVREDAGLQPMAGGTFPSAAAGKPTANVVDRADCVTPLAGQAAKTPNLDETWLNGLPVVVGDGYPDDAMVFATGAIVVTRGSLEQLTPTPASAMGRAANDLYGLMERSYLVAVDNPIACFT